MLRRTILVVCFSAVIFLSACSGSYQSIASINEKGNLEEFPGVPEKIKEYATHPSSETYPYVMSYDMGYYDAKVRLRAQPVDILSYLEGALDALLGKNRVVPENKLRELERTYYIKMLPVLQFRRSKENWQKISKLKGAHSSRGGFYYQVIQKGRSGEELKENDYVSFYYRSYILSGDELDNHQDTPVVSQVADMPILGLVLKTMHPGDVWRAYLPYPLAYGKKGTSSVPPYAIVVYEIQVIKKEKKPKNHHKRF